MGTCFYKNYPFLSENVKSRYYRKARKIYKRNKILLKRPWSLDILPTKNYYMYHNVKSILDFEFKN